MLNVSMLNFYLYVPVASLKMVIPKSVSPGNPFLKLVSQWDNSLFGSINSKNPDDLENSYM